MPFLAAAAPLIGGALGLGSAGTAALGAGLGVAGSLASGGGKTGYSPTQVNIDQLNNQIKSISTQNAIDSANLEKQLTPLVPALRNAANAGVISGLTPDANTLQQQQILQAGVGKNLNTPVLDQSIAEAGRQLSLGAQLPQDVQNQVTRQALANGGSVAGPGGGLNLGHDLAARDLGLTGLQLQQQRLNTALGAGTQQQSLAQANQSNLLNHIGLLQQMSQNQFGRNIAAAQYGQGIQQPNVGIDPSSAANIAVGNTNAQNAAMANNANIRGQQNNNYLNFGGQLLGYGLLGANNPGTYNFNAGSQSNNIGSGYGLGQNPSFLSGAQPFKF